MARTTVHRMLFPALVVIAAFLQYANTIPNQFAWDDSLVILENDYTRQGISGLKDIFTKRVSVPYKNVYRPIPQATFALEYQLFGENPHWMHLSSVLWYALCCLTVFHFLRYVLPKTSPLFSLMVTLLFVVHPLHVEVVANIKSRDEVMALLFSLLALLLLMKGLERRKLVLILAAIPCFAAALLSKENAIALLPLAAMGLWFRSDELRPKPEVYLAAALVLLFLGVYFEQVLLWLGGATALAYSGWQRHFGKVAVSLTIAAAALLFWFGAAFEDPAPSESLRLDSSVLNNIFLWTTESDKVLPTAIVNVGRYLKLFLYPHPLLHLYGYDQIPLRGWSHPATLSAIVLLALAALYLWLNWREKRPGVFGLILFGLSYSVYSNVFVLAPDTMADRYLFIASLGLCLLFVEGLFRIGQIPLDAPSFASIRPKIVAAALCIVISGFFLRTWIGNTDWYDDETLIGNRIRYMQDNAAAHANMGMVHLNKGAQATSLEEHRASRQAAMDSFKRALQIYPDFHWVWVSVGQVFAENGDFEKAELAFLKAQRLEPFSPDGYYSMGALYSLLGELDLAITYLERSVLLDPNTEETYILLGESYLRNGDMDNLGSMAETARKWFPARSEFDAFHAAYFLGKGDHKNAAKAARSALQKDTDNDLAIRVLLAIPPEG